VGKVGDKDTRDDKLFLVVKDDRLLGLAGAPAPAAPLLVAAGLVLVRLLGLLLLLPPLDLLAVLDFLLGCFELRCPKKLSSNTLSA
jgi:hypothetical protein